MSVLFKTKFRTNNGILKLFREFWGDSDGDGSDNYSEASADDKKEAAGIYALVKDSMTFLENDCSGNIGTGKKGRVVPKYKPKQSKGVNDRSEINSEGREDIYERN